MKKKLHVYILVSYKGQECTIVKVYSSKELAEKSKAKHYKRLNLKPLMRGKIVTITYHILEFAVSGAVDTTSRLSYLRKFIGFKPFSINERVYEFYKD